MQSAQRDSLWLFNSAHTAHKADIEEFASKNEILQQLTDLALLANGLLKGNDPLRGPVRFQIMLQGYAIPSDRLSVIPTDFQDGIFFSVLRTGSTP